MYCSFVKKETNRYIWRGNVYSFKNSEYKSVNMRILDYDHFSNSSYHIRLVGRLTIDNAARTCSAPNLQ